MGREREKVEGANKPEDAEVLDMRQLGGGRGGGPSRKIVNRVKRAKSTAGDPRSPFQQKQGARSRGKVVRIGTKGGKGEELANWEKNVCDWGGVIWVVSAR